MIRIDTTADLADTLRTLRKLAGITQTAVGHQLGTTPQRIGDYEHGRLNPSAKTLLRLLHAIGYTLAIVPLEDPSGPGKCVWPCRCDEPKVHTVPKEDA